MDAETSGIVDEIIQRHHASQGLDSRALVSVVEAIRDVIQAQGMILTPVSLFAAAAASLTTATSDDDMQASAPAPSRRSTICAPPAPALPRKPIIWCLIILVKSLQTATALCTFMSTILERLPAKFLRSQFGSVTALLCAVIEQHRDEVSCWFVDVQGGSDGETICFSCSPSICHVVLIDRHHHPGVNNQASTGLPQRNAGCAGTGRLAICEAPFRFVDVFLPQLATQSPEESTRWPVAGAGIHPQHCSTGTCKRCSSIR